jgi:hypothetical protein
VTHTYHTQKLKGRIKIYAYQTKEASKVEKSLTSPSAHQNVANYILHSLYFFGGQTKYSKVNHARKNKGKPTQRILNFSLSESGVMQHLITKTKKQKTKQKKKKKQEKLCKGSPACALQGFGMLPSTLTCKPCQLFVFIYFCNVTLKVQKLSI